MDEVDINLHVGVTNPATQLALPRLFPHEAVIAWCPIVFWKLFYYLHCFVELTCERCSENSFEVPRKHSIIILVSDLCGVNF